MRAARFWYSEPRSPSRPYAFISYGMTRCGSTLAFELTRVALLQAGYDQPLLPLPGRPAQVKTNYTETLDEENLRVMIDHVQDRGHPVVVKVHTAPTEPLLRGIETGAFRAHAVFRDPRDMALSLLDIAEKSRRRGGRAFSNLHTIPDTLATIDTQMGFLAAWLEIPGIRRLQYDTLAFQTDKAAEAILDHLEVSGNASEIANRVLEHEFTQRNKAIAMRHALEMDPETSAVFRSRYAPFYDEILDKPDPGSPLAKGKRQTDTGLSEPEPTRTAPLSRKDPP